MFRFSRSTFIRFGLFALFSVLATGINARNDAENYSKTELKASRLKIISKGFNLEHCQRHGLADGFYTEAILQQYKSLGLTYTRVPIILSDFFNDKKPSVLKTGSLAALDAMIQMHVKIGLGIIVSPFNHPDKLYSDPAVLEKFVVFFKTFATHLNSTDPEKVFLEVMNEPSAKTPQAWNNVQLKLLAAIRSGAPNHTIIASSNLRVSENKWDNVRALPMTQIVEDKNVVYNFHFYDPYVFTHQGASWGWEALKFMKDIPYPSNLQAVAPLLNSIQDSQAKWAVKNYGKENWNREKLVSFLSIVAHWAKTNGVPISCNEFGAIPWKAPRESQLRYLRDVREVLESYGIGWGQWFGLDVHDREIIQALGLKPLSRR